MISNAKEEVERLGRVVRTPTGVTVAGQEHIQHADAVTAGFDNYIGVAIGDIYGPEVAADVNSRSPIPLAEHRQAKALIERLKHDSEFQKKLQAGDTFAKARWSLAHRQVVRPIKDDQRRRCGVRSAHF